ncbi:MAG TPA: hypothetical protein VGR45_07235 [Stellaceae bacterium]|nr:hypothetical protein [Stellaceae bacterium]
MPLITYAQQVVGSGMIAGQTFANANVLLTMNSDTSTVVKVNDRVSVNHGTLSVNVSGVEAEFGVSQIFNSQESAEAGFQPAGTGLDVLTTSNPTFATYDLTTSIGPISGTPGINPGHRFVTTDGNAFVLNSVAPQATFTATLLG